MTLPVFSSVQLCSVRKFASRLPYGWVFQLCG